MEELRRQGKTRVRMFDGRRKGVRGEEKEEEDGRSTEGGEVREAVQMREKRKVS